MKKILLILISSLLLANCSVNNKNKIASDFQSITIDTLIKDKISIRAIVIDNNKVWYAADKNKFGFYDLISKQKTERIIRKDSLQFEFRSIAKNNQNIFVLNVGNPALLYQISKEALQPKLVYQEINEKVFYDSMQFWNDQEGIAIGDPITNCLSIIITRDGGKSWQKTLCEKLPNIVNGEAAFAASNTNICIKGAKTWVVTGGKKSRVFYSPDKGKHWEVFETPIVQGLEMTGVFTADFYDDKTGIIAGGNYEIPNQNYSNKAITNDGGKTWNLIADNQGFGYASCVQFIPNSNKKQLVCVGALGLYYSSDFGNTWSKLLDNKELYTLRFINTNTAIAAGRNGMFKINFK
jgi:photosystem II stability/assembly factor-like uncharacterized protein